MGAHKIAFTGGNIIDGHLDHDVIQDGTILIDCPVGDKRPFGVIEQVGRSAEIEIPNDYQVVSLKNRYVLPGLINCHAHLPFDGAPKQPMSGRKAEKLIRKLKRSTLFQRVYARKLRKNMANAVNAGITTVRGMAEPLYAEVALRKAQEKGLFTAPRIITAGPGICPTGGHANLISWIADGPWEFRKYVRKNIHEEVDFIKILSTGGVSDSRFVGEAGRVIMKPEEIEAACDEAHRNNMLVASHVQSPLGMKEAVKAGVDTIEHGSDFDDETADLMLENPKSLRGYTAVVPTFSPAQAIVDRASEGIITMTDVQVENSKIILERMLKGARVCLDKGVLIGVGNDAIVPYVTQYNLWKELVLLVKYLQISHQHVIHLATLSSARAINVDKITGSIEPGKSADFMVVDQNPLDDLKTLAHPSKVCCMGRLIENPLIQEVKGVDTYRII